MWKDLAAIFGIHHLRNCSKYIFTKIKAAPDSFSEAASLSCGWFLLAARVYLHDLHHAQVFVTQNVAVEHEAANVHSAEVHQHLYLREGMRPIPEWYLDHVRKLS